jgi:phosphoribosyl-ATP pyrophosphohydrolase
VAQLEDTLTDRPRKTLADWQREIGAWHERIFPTARLSHIMEKLAEERREAVLAWAGAGGNNADVADELADCLVCVLAAMAREDIDAETALASKFERVLAKYHAEEPELPL